MVSTTTTALFFSSTLCLILPNNYNVLSFPLSSSQSSNPKKLLTNKKKGAQGFGKKTSDPILHTVDTSQTITDLIKFLTSQNAKGFSREERGCEIGISDESGMRGVYASKSFKNNEIICQIPSDCALALSNPDLGGVDAPTVAHCGRNFLDMYTNHPTASKTWAPYLNSLPSLDSAHFDATPDFFTDEEIEAMELPWSKKQVEQRLVDIAELCAKDDISFEDLQFATWLVSSRALEISVGEQEDSDVASDLGASDGNVKSIRVMLPFLDMINHSSDNANCEMHLIDPEKDEAWFAIRTKRPIKKGKQITISYGTGVETSPALLHNYGFVPSGNRFDKLMVKTKGDDVIDSLEGWTTSLEEDESLLKNPDLSGNMKKILQMRRQLKLSYT